MTSSWFLLSTLNYDARSTTHQIYRKQAYESDVHRAVHRNIISIVKPTNVSNLLYFGMALHMFRTVFPSFIRSSRLYIQQQAYVKMILLLPCAAVCLLASRQQHLFGCCMYSLELLMMDRYCCLIARE